jgi:hypothetical protein
LKFKPPGLHPISEFVFDLASGYSTIRGSSRTSLGRWLNAIAAIAPGHFVPIRYWRYSDWSAPVRAVHFQSSPQSTSSYAALSYFPVAAGSLSQHFIAVNQGDPVVRKKKKTKTLRFTLCQPTLSAAGRASAKPVYLAEQAKSAVIATSLAVIARNETSPALTVVQHLRKSPLPPSSLPPPHRHSNLPSPLRSLHMPTQLPQSMAHTQPILRRPPARIRIYRT